MSLISQLWFHESTMSSFRKTNGLVTLDIKNVVTGDSEDKRSDVLITLQDVNKIDSDAEINNENLMAANDGEILTLNLKDTRLELIVQWEEYDKKLSFIKYYFIDFTHYELQIKATYFSSDNV